MLGRNEKITVSLNDLVNGKDNWAHIIYLANLLVIGINSSDLVQNNIIWKWRL